MMEATVMREESKQEESRNPLPVSHSLPLKSILKKPPSSEQPILDKIVEKDPYAASRVVEKAEEEEKPKKVSKFK